MKVCVQDCVVLLVGEFRKDVRFGFGRVGKQLEALVGMGRQNYLVESLHTMSVYYFYASTGATNRLDGRIQKDSIFQRGQQP
jgi:hypothetical protein